MEFHKRLFIQTSITSEISSMLVLYRVDNVTCDTKMMTSKMWDTKMH